MSTILPVTNDPPMPRIWSILVPVLLLVACFAAYLPAIRGDFIWDDDYYVVNNVGLRDNAGLQKLWIGLLQDPQAYPAPQFYPMTHTSLWIDYRIWGLNPVGYHITNVLLHVLCAWTLWVILRKLAVPGATLAVFIFALHPVHVESVAWITERKNVLSGLFYLLSMLVYLRFAGLDPKPISNAAVPADTPEEGAAKEEYKLELPDEPWKVYVLALLLFVFALLSKTVTATLPAAILLVVFWKRKRIDLQRDVVPLIPFFVLGLVFSSITSWMEKSVVGAAGAEWNYTLAERTIIAGKAVWFYVGKLIWPAGLTFIYPKWAIDPNRVAQWLAPLSVVAALVALVLTRKKIGDGLLLGVLFFGGTLLPALGFFNYFPMRYSFVADHFAYLASIGLIVPAAALATQVFRGARTAGMVAAVLLCAGFALLSMQQSRIYAGPTELWQSTIARNPNSWMAHNNLGAQYMMRKQYELAQKSFETSADLNKNIGDPVSNLAKLAEERGDIATAEKLYQHAIQLYQAYAARDEQVLGKRFVRRRHADPFVSLAALRLKQNDLKTAEALFEEAIKLHPNNIDAMSGLGETLRLQGKYPEALGMQLQAIVINPESVPVRIALGLALADNGKPDEAMRAWLSVLHDEPENAEAHLNMGRLMLAGRQYDEAIARFERALKARPTWEAARLQLEAAKRRKAAAATQPSAATAPSTQPK